MPLIPVPIYGGVQNVLETFEMAIEHKKRTARTEIRVFSVAGFLIIIIIIIIIIINRLV